MTMSPCISEYTDYRSFLRDFYVHEKKRNASYSFRVFAKKAGLSSPNYLKLVMDGSRRITDQTLPKFVRGLRLAPMEARYFRSLVLFQESKDSESKSMHLREAVYYRQKISQKSTQLQKDELLVLKDWYHWVIKELIQTREFSENPEWIARQLKNKITPQQAQNSLSLLERLGHLERQDGRYRVLNPMTVTGADDDLASLLIRDLHRQFLGLAQESLKEDETREREMNGLILAVPRKRLAEMKALVREFRQEVNRRFTTEDVADDVYYVNVSLFPLTKKREEKGEK